MFDLREDHWLRQGQQVLWTRDSGQAHVLHEVHPDLEYKL